MTTIDYRKHNVAVLRLAASEEQNIVVADCRFHAMTNYQDHFEPRVAVDTKQRERIYRQF